MLRNFFTFELRNYRKKPLVYLLTALNFTLLFLSATQENLTIGYSSAGQFLNAPFSVAMSAITISLLFGLFMALAFANGAALRDFNSNFHSILYSYPLRRSSYYWGRFLAAWSLTLLPLLGGLLGLGIGASMPFAPAGDIGASHPAGYLQAVLLFLLPNAFILTALSYSLALRFRSATAGFVGTVIFLLLYMIAGRAVLSTETGQWAIILDPLGFNTLIHTTRYWTVSELNTRLVFTEGAILFNRGLWLALSGALLLGQYRRFAFTYTLRTRRKKLAPTAPTASAPSRYLPPVSIPTVAFSANLRTRWAQLRSMVAMDLRGMLQGRVFWILVLLAVVNGLNMLAQADGWYNNGSYPVTYIMVDALHSGFQLFMYAIVIFYAGALVWRERDHDFQGIADAMPYSRRGRVSAKILSLLTLVGLLQSISILLAVGMQLSKGYTAIDFAQYAAEILGLDFLTFLWLTLLSVLLQSLIHQKYIAYGATLVVLLIVAFGLPQLGVESYLLRYGQLPAHTYSDMNGYGPFGPTLLLYCLYWTLLALLFWGLASRFWVRGSVETFRRRWALAWQGYSPTRQGTLAALLLVFFLCGGFLYYHTQVLNAPLSSRETKQRQAEYEHTYGQYRTLNQPRIVATDYTVDMYPERRTVKALAAVRAVNRGTTPIREVHLTLPQSIEVSVDWPQGTTLRHDDARLKYQIYILPEPLAPGDTLAYTVHAHYAPKGLQDRGIFTDVVQNGIFLTNQDLMPTLGYLAQHELAEPKERAKQGLPEKALLPLPEASQAFDRNRNYVTADADWVQLSATLSTTPDQVAVAPGNLVREWEADGRRYFRYQLPRSTLNFYNFVSARYQIARRTWRKPGHAPVALEVYHHPDHHYNVERMLEALAAGLDYYTQAFGPYGLQQARIVEFPRYGEYAQAFPGTMPYSEGVGFITDLTDPEAIDQVYFVVAHELAHQWWAHQVVGARTAGSTMLSETFAQYSALMVMKNAYGPHRMKQFLAYERDRYLRSRSGDPQPEQALVYNQNQSYIHYRKGSVQMYSLSEYIGEDQVNTALRQFLEDHRYAVPPYSTSLEALAELQKVTPDSLQYLLSDMFADIILYQNETVAAEARHIEEDRYALTLSLKAAKLRADGEGVETAVPLNDWIDVGVYPKATREDPFPAPLALHRLRLRGDTTITLYTEGIPARAGIDPNHLLIDRDPDNNLRNVTLVEE